MSEEQSECVSSFGVDTGKHDSDSVRASISSPKFQSSAGSGMVSTHFAPLKPKPNPSQHHVLTLIKSEPQAHLNQVLLSVAVE